jgi:hypothetical protein
MKSVTIYVNPNTDATKALMGFIADNIDEIMKRIEIKRIKVDKTNSKKLQAQGITKTPTLVYEGKQYVGAQKIMRILKPPTAQRDNFGAHTSPEEMVHKYLERAIGTPGDAEEDEDENGNREAQLRQRMTALEKRRKGMIGGTDHPNMKGGGRKRGAPQKAKTFETDEDFIGQADRDEETPTEPAAEEDGALIWENELNMLADQMGRKVGGKIGKRR